MSNRITFSLCMRVKQMIKTTRIKLSIYNQRAYWGQRVMFIIQSFYNHHRITLQHSSWNSNLCSEGQCFGSSQSLNFVVAEFLLQNLRTRSNNKALIVSYYHPNTYVARTRTWTQSHEHDTDTDTGIRQFLKNKDTTRRGHGG